MKNILRIDRHIPSSHLSGGGELSPPAEGGPASAAATAVARRGGVTARGHHEAVGGGGYAGRGDTGGLADVDVHGAERGAQGVDARQALAPALQGTERERAWSDE